MSVTVPGVGGSIITLATTGTANQFLSQTVANLLAAAKTAGTLATQNFTGGTVPLPSLIPGDVNELTVTIPGALNFTMPAGYQALTLGDGSTTTVTGTSGLAVIAGNSVLDYIGATGVETVTGAGTSTVSLPTGSTSFITLGSGNDTIISGGSGTLAGGGGNNYISVASAPVGTSNWVISDGTDTVVAGAGRTTVAAYGAGDSIQGGSGSLVVGGSHTGNTTVNAASGPSTIWGGQANLVNGGSGAILFIGLANSTATVNGASGMATIYGAPGDNLQYNNSTGGGGAVMAAYGGNETLNAAGSNAPVTLSAGSGNTTLIGGSANDLLNAGTGSSSITTGAGSDTVDFYSGGAGGANVISDFSTSDVLMLSNYGSGAADAAFNSVKPVTGGVQITLADSTTITFQGISSLTGYKITSF